MHILSEHQKRAVREIAQALAATSDAALLEEFLHGLLTPAELDNVSTRWELVKLIDEGMSQRKIAEKLGVSLCKITRGSRELKKENSAFGRMIHTALPRAGRSPEA